GQNTTVFCVLLVLLDLAHSSPPRPATRSLVAFFCGGHVSMLPCLRFHRLNQILSASLCEVHPDRGCRVVRVHDFLRDKSCRRILANFQVQSVTRCHEGSRHALNDLKLKGLISKKARYRHEHDLSLWS